MKKKIGLSLSFCVQDIIEGKVALEDVEKIITGTKFGDRDEFIDNMISSYMSTYWRKHPEEGFKTAVYLWDRGMLDQPRTRGEEPPNLGNGVWI